MKCKYVCIYGENIYKIMLIIQTLDFDFSRSFGAIVCKMIILNMSQNVVISKLCLILQLITSIYSIFCKCHCITVSLLFILVQLTATACITVPLPRKSDLYCPV